MSVMRELEPMPVFCFFLHKAPANAHSFCCVRLVTDSLMLSVLDRNMVMRSIPIPQPAVGGRPKSRAWMMKKKTSRARRDKVSKRRSGESKRAATSGSGAAKSCESGKPSTRPDMRPRSPGPTRGSRPRMGLSDQEIRNAEGGVGGMARVRACEERRRRRRRRRSKKKNKKN